MGSGIFAKNDVSSCLILIIGLDGYIYVCSHIYEKQQNINLFKRLTETIVFYLT